MSFVRGRGRGRGFFKNSDSHYRKFHTKSVNQNHAPSGSMDRSVSEVVSGSITVQNSRNINFIKVNLNLDCDSEEWFIRLRNLWSLCNCILRCMFA